MIDFNRHVLERYDSHGPVLQPRMGFSCPARMQAGLEATATSRANTVCTITLDAFTRVKDLDAAQRAIDSDSMLNGYPIVNHPAAQTRAMLDEIHTRYRLPVQIRHGSPDPLHIFQRMVEIGSATTEGGPLSYCLPYSRTPLRQAFAHWEKACQVLASGVEHSHIESFAGCMMGQMCDPAVLIALNILEGLFLRAQGIETLSFSYAQGTSPVQDRAAVTALQQLAAEFFAPGSYHCVGYVFMGFFPRTLGGFCRITGDALGMIRATGVQRVIIKTPVESRRIPRIEENIAALEYADYCLRTDGVLPDIPFDRQEYVRIFNAAKRLIEGTLARDSDLSEAILDAFDSGFLSIPYCLHPDNKRGVGTVVTAQNYYQGFEGERVENAFSFLAALRHNIRTYDAVL
ncbi:methylaspartate mutase [Pseudomonas frederiksbergensis]|uniref:Glutamate mutase epsilon subunit n=1 Tax=Pseudomonas frederiksbergensis TaxID=104087 RepID=A0A6L5C0P5_9PSED|nr:methylaspartate mutase [Pseudomonas frederiksbergensis]KAF2394168.1 Glutamate mutase epsilon subunit [Pseudomonas frederiksbergensis]